MNVRDGLIMVVILGLVAGVFFLHGSTSIPSTQQEKTPAVQKSEVGAEEGSIAPNLNLTTLDGKSVSLSQYKGKPTLITFWTTWCGYCRSEMPVIQKAFEQYKDQVNFLIVNVTSDDDEKKVATFIKEKKYTFPVLLDKSGKGSEDYGVRGLPTNFILSKEGRIQMRKSGAMAFSELDQVLKKALQGK